MLDQRQRRWADFVQMLYKCFVLSGIPVSNNKTKAVIQGGNSTPILSSQWDSSRAEGNEVSRKNVTKSCYYTMADFKRGVPIWHFHKVFISYLYCESAIK